MLKTASRILVFLLLLTLSSLFPSLNMSADQGLNLNLDKSTYTGLGDSMKVTFTSSLYNKSIREAETIPASITTSQNPSGITILLSETGKDTGIFSAIIRFSNSRTESTTNTIKVVPNVQIFVKCSTESADALWVPDEGTLSLDKDAYFGTGIRPIIKVEDQDLNKNSGIIDTVKVKVTSDSDKSEIWVQLEEEACDAGIFTGSFGFALDKSSENKIHIKYADRVTVAYEDSLTSDISSSLRTVSADWKPATASIDTNKNELLGLISVARVTVDDSDMDLGHNSIDIVNVRVTSEADPKGISVRLYETNVNSGVFTGDVKLSDQGSNPRHDTIKVGSKSKLKIEYLDAWNSTNQRNTAISATADFEQTGGSLDLSSEALEGSGGYITVTVTDLDIGSVSNKDFIPINVVSASDPKGLTLYLEETGESSSKFSGKLYFSDERPTDKALRDTTILVSQGDEVQISYTDKTCPDGITSVVTKTAIWSYSKAQITFDQESYTGYNNAATITVKDAEANKSASKVNQIRVKISSTSSKGFEMQLEETKENSGEFKGKVTFGKNQDISNKYLAVLTGDTITVKYEDQGPVSSGLVEASTSWVAHDAELAIDNTEYYGFEAAIKITLKDWDIASKPNEKDKAQLAIVPDGGGGRKSILLTETGSNTGVFSATLYINNAENKTPCIYPKNGQRIAFIYMDYDTTTKEHTERSAYATWYSHK